MTQGMTFRQFADRLRRAPDRRVRIVRLLCILATVLATTALGVWMLVLVVQAVWG